MALYFQKNLTSAAGADCRHGRLNEFRQRVDQHQHSRATLQPSIAASLYIAFGVQCHRRVGTRSGARFAVDGARLRHDAGRSETGLSVVGKSVTTIHWRGERMQAILMLLVLMVGASPVCAQSKASEK